MNHLRRQRFSCRMFWNYFKRYKFSAIWKTMCFVNQFFFLYSLLGAKCRPNGRNIIYNLSWFIIHLSRCYQCGLQMTSKSSSVQWSSHELSLSVRVSTSLQQKSYCICMTPIWFPKIKAREWWALNQPYTSYMFDHVNGAAAMTSVCELEFLTTFFIPFNHKTWISELKPWSSQ